MAKPEPSSRINWPLIQRRLAALMFAELSGDHKTVSSIASAALGSRCIEYKELIAMHSAYVLAANWNKPPSDVTRGHPSLIDYVLYESSAAGRYEQAIKILRVLGMDKREDFENALEVRYGIKLTIFMTYVTQDKRCRRHDIAKLVLPHASWFNKMLTFRSAISAKDVDMMHVVYDADFNNSPHVRGSNADAICAALQTGSVAMMQCILEKAAAIEALAVDESVQKAIADCKSQAVLQLLLKDPRLKCVVAAMAPCLP